MPGDGLAICFQQSAHDARFFHCYRETLGLQRFTDVFGAANHYRRLGTGG